MLGMEQTVVTSVPMLIVDGTVFVKNRLEAGRGEREEGDRKGGWKRRRERGWEEGSRGDGKGRRMEVWKEGEKGRMEEGDRNEMPHACVHTCISHCVLFTDSNQ